METIVGGLPNITTSELMRLAEGDGLLLDLTAQFVQDPTALSLLDDFVEDGKPLMDSLDEMRLGYDPQNSRYLPREAETGRWLEQNQGVRLKREGFSDWTDVATGITYDAVGPPNPLHFNPQQFMNAVVDHLPPAHDRVVVDLVGLQPSQQDIIVNEIQKLSSTDQSAIIIRR